MPTEIDILGYIAAVLTSGAFVPQALLVWRTDDTRSISLGMYSVLAIGIALWLAYGVLVDSYPIILANAFTLMMSISILFKKVTHLRAGRV